MVKYFFYSGCYKMKIFKLLILSILSVFLIGLVNAELGVNQTQLKLTVDAKVDGKSSGTDLSDQDEITRDANPESSVKLTVNVENLYDSDTQNYDLEDVALTVTVIGIEDQGDDDIELDGEISRIRPERTSKESFTINVPLLVDEGSYDITIDADFDDNNPNATIDSASMTLTLNVEKEKHNVIISRAELSKNNLGCSLQTTLNTQIMNLGQEEEEEAVLEIASEELKINVKDTVDLTEDPFDDENVYSKNVAINAKDLKPGTYPITIRAYRNTDNLEATKNVELVVAECVEEPEEPKDKEPEITVAVCGNGKVEAGEECDDSNKANGDGCSSLCDIETPVSPVTPLPLETGENFWEKYGTTVMIIVGELVFLLVILVIIAVALRKK